MPEMNEPLWRRLSQRIARVSRALCGGSRGRGVACAETAAGPAANDGNRGTRTTRRKLLGALGSLSGLGLVARPEQARAEPKADAAARPSPILITPADAKEFWRLKRLNLEDAEVAAKQKKMPTGKIGKLTVSRLISGSNLINLNMHARDLSYVRDLAARYNTEERIFMTLKKCEEAGVNTIVLKANNFRSFRLSRYWQEDDWGGKMQWIADVITTDITKYEQLVEQHLDLGASAVYLWGGASDIWYHRNQKGNIIKAFEIMRKYDVPVGIGAHRLEPIAFCQREGLKPDFYLKTLHHDRYWSAHPKENRRPLEMYEEESPRHGEYHDNLFCQDAEETAAFMQDVKVPWIAFKVLAAGAIPPKNGFQHAFDCGADFICVGMFDFQVEEDARLTTEIVAGVRQRKRPWA